MLSEYSWLEAPVSPFISKLKLGPEIYSKSLGTMNALGNVTWYDWAGDNCSTTHVSDFKSNSAGRGSYSLINIAVSWLSVVSRDMLLAITRLLDPKLR